jgi:hypothetical protein
MMSCRVADFQKILIALAVPVPFNGPGALDVFDARSALVASPETVAEQAAD